MKLKDEFIWQSTQLLVFVDELKLLKKNNIVLQSLGKVRCNQRAMPDNREGQYEAL